MPLGSTACMNLDRSLHLSHTDIKPHSLYQYFLNDCLYYKCLLLLEDSPIRGIIMPILYLVQIQFMYIRLYHEEKEAKGVERKSSDILVKSQFGELKYKRKLK